MSDFLYWWPIVLVPIGWFSVCWIISRVGGWAWLAKAYPAQNSTLMEGESWRFQSIQMRWASNYGNCVTVRANSMGLGLSVLWLLRFGHPPLLIPWSDITVHRVRRSRFFPSLVEFRFRSEPSVPVRIYNKLFLKILASSDRYYPNFRQISAQIAPPSNTEAPQTSHF
jgi:hypothetical protein